MKKIHIILFILVLSVIWAQKEVPREGGTLETTGDERLNGKDIQPIDADFVQQVRMLKANKEKAFMKKQILSAQKVDTKTFKVPKQESKFLAVKKIIKIIKQESERNSKPNAITFKNYVSDNNITGKMTKKDNVNIK